jgi:hypothetical protein
MLIDWMLRETSIGVVDLVDGDEVLGEWDGALVNNFIIGASVILFSTLGLLVGQIVAANEELGVALGVGSSEKVVEFSALARLSKISCSFSLSSCTFVTLAGNIKSVSLIIGSGTSSSPPVRTIRCTGAGAAFLTGMPFLPAQDVIKMTAIQMESLSAVMVARSL